MLIILSSLYVDHSDSVGSLGFSYDGLLLASGGLDGAVNIWDTSSGVLKNKLEGPTEAIEVVQRLHFES